MRIVSELPGLTGDRPVHRIGGRDLCDLLEITPAALTSLCKRGLAVKIGHDAYDLTATVTAYIVHLRAAASGRGGEAHSLTLAGERARLARAQADAQEVKNRMIAGELVPAAEVTREWADTLRGLRSQVLAVPSRIRSTLPHLTAQDVAQIDRELRDTLAEMGGGDGEH